MQTALVPDLFQKLRQNEVELLYFLDEKVYFPDWSKVFERPENIYFVPSANSALAGQPGIPAERLMREPLYLTEKGISYRCAMEQALAERGFDLHPFLEIGNTGVIVRLLRQNRGISFLPGCVAREELASGGWCITATSALRRR